MDAPNPQSESFEVAFDGDINRVLVLADRGKADVDDLVQQLEPFLAKRVEAVVVEGDLLGEGALGV